MLNPIQFESWERQPRVAAMVQVAKDNRAAREANEANASMTKQDKKVLKQANKHYKRKGL